MLHIRETDIRIARAVKSKQKAYSGQRVAPQRGNAIEARLVVAIIKDDQVKTVAS